MIVTKLKLEEAKTERGGYTKKQILLAQSVFGKRWMSSMTDKVVTAEFWMQFCELSKVSKRQSMRRNKAKKKQVLNQFPTAKDNWSWKPDKQDVPELKFRANKNGKNRNKHQEKRLEISRLDAVAFYESREWRELRYRVIQKYESKCMACGRTPLKHGVIIHVDHIKPRSKYPELALVFENLQILCEDCNIGKSNKDETDWRPDDPDEVNADMEILAEARKWI